MDSKELEAVLAVVRRVLEENHAYYMAHPDYPMPKPCMWPDELTGEIRAELAGTFVTKSPQNHSTKTASGLTET